MKRLILLLALTVALAAVAPAEPPIVRQPGDPGVTVSEFTWIGKRDERRLQLDSLSLPPT